MIDVPARYLVEVLDDETALRVMNALQGCRIYFPSYKVRVYNLKQDYRMMKTTHMQKIEQLAFKYDITKGRIRQILRDKNELLNRE